MDVTLWRARPREVPVDKPSAEQTLIPRVLLRADDGSADGKHRARWMPSETRPGASKHLASGQAKLSHHTRLDPPVTVSELDSERLQTLEDELTHLEAELDYFVHDFYVAAATFSAQADAQKRLLKKLQKEEKRS